MFNIYELNVFSYLEVQILGIICQLKRIEEFFVLFTTMNFCFTMRTKPTSAFDNIWHQNKCTIDLMSFCNITFVKHRPENGHKR
jgi:hypothetical protein